MQKSNSIVIFIRYVLTSECDSHWQLIFVSLRVIDYVKVMCHHDNDNDDDESGG